MSHPHSPASRRRFFFAAISVMMLVLFTSASAAGAITRDEVLARAKSWVDRKVPYSQRRHFEGYRQDCSGFVSMAWKLETSYTTRSIPQKAEKIQPAALMPGDVVWNPGHVVLFVSWTDKKAGTFNAYEEPSSGKTARRSEQTIRRSTKAYRLKGIAETPPPPPPAPTPAPVAAPQPEVRTPEFFELLPASSRCGLETVGASGRLL